MGTSRQQILPRGQDVPLIAADVGGTHARVGLIGAGADRNGRFSISHYRKYACADFPSLAAIIGEFRQSVAQVPVDRVALAIAGYVVDDAVVNVNLPWAVSISGLRAALGVRDLAIVNDFEAVAHAIGHVDMADTTLLSGPSIAPQGPVLVVGPGTGLGAAVRIPHGDHPLILATEAGQATLAPNTDFEIDVLRELRRRGSRVLIEHVLSGTGLMNLHAAIRALHGAAAMPMTPAQISAAALAGSDPLALETVEVFCGWFGGVLGDLALLYGAQGGIYLAGGVLPQIRDLLMRSTFVERFLDKGAMREALARTPVRLVDHAQLGVIGAASWYFARDSDPSARALTR
ncbi:glucokinase [Dokdonella soli]|uniref:Glucokinase family protein n=1 Tax=Dokdonella soli TaxID=529810 RepID=A0ABN1IMI9_9GAMM